MDRLTEETGIFACGERLRAERGDICLRQAILRKKGFETLYIIEYLKSDGGFVFPPFFLRS